MNFNDPLWNKKITITLPAVQWLSVHGNTSLGLRHPENKGLSRQYSAGFLMKLEGLLLDEGLFSLDDISSIHDFKN